MVLHRFFLVFFITFVHILVDAASQDICQSCKPLEECPQFGAMTKEQQEQFVQDFPCDEGSRNTVSGFSAVAKGDYVCCPRSDFSGVNEDKYRANGKQDRVEITPNKYQSNNYPYYNQNENGRMGSFSNTPDGLFNQCRTQYAPPNPESGCCGVEFADNFGITDVPRFIQGKEANSNRRYQKKYQRHQMDGFKRRTRDIPAPALNVTFENRIAGGTEAGFDQYPWTVFIKLGFIEGGTKKYFACGGSLISSRFILSAAHCFISDNSGELDEVEATLSEYDITTFPRDCVENPGQDPVCIDNEQIPVDTVVTHPLYDREFLINDIALVRLAYAAPYTRYIRPICLPPVNIDSPQFANLPLATAGWGLNVSVESNIKQFTVIQMVPKNECQRHYAQLTNGHLCASGKKSEDTCKGDSGGPLMMKFQGKYYLAGIVSGKLSAYQCGTPIPSLYTNVYYYLNWIRNFTG